MATERAAQEEGMSNKNNAPRVTCDIASCHWSRVSSLGWIVDCGDKILFAPSQRKDTPDSGVRTSAEQRYAPPRQAIALLWSKEESALQFDVHN